MPEQLNETVFDELEFFDEGQNSGGPWRVKAVGLTADEGNANGRLYPVDVVAKAVEEARQRLDEGQSITGQVEHPRIAANLGETVFNWTDIALQGNQIALEGLLLATQAGKDLREMAKGGVRLGLSQRAKGDTRPKNNLREVTNFSILGYDAVINPSDRVAAVNLLESNNHNEGEFIMPKELTQQINEYIDAQTDTLIRFDESARQSIAKGIKTLEAGVF